MFRTKNTLDSTLIYGGINIQLEKHERIRKFILTAKEWTVENNELTPTLKPRRSILYQNFKAEIDKLYSK